MLLVLPISPVRAEACSPWPDPRPRSPAGRGPLADYGTATGRSQSSMTELPASDPRRRRGDQRLLNLLVVSPDEEDCRHDEEQDRWTAQPHDEPAELLIGRRAQARDPRRRGVDGIEHPGRERD